MPGQLKIKDCYLKYMLKYYIPKIVVVINIFFFISAVQVTKTEQENLQIEMDEKALENDHDQADGVDESNLSEVGVIGSTVWAESEISRGNDTYLFFLCLLYTNDIIFILSY